MVPVNYLHGLVLKYAKIQSVCRLPLYLVHSTYAMGSHTTPTKLHHLHVLLCDSHDELVIEILHSSSNNIPHSFCNDPRPTSWSAHLIVLVLATTFKCSLKAFLTSTTLFSPPIVMVLTHARHWAWVMLLGCPFLESSTRGTRSLQIM